MGAMDEVFGFLPARPDTDEFWRLSSLVLELDGRMEAATTEEEKERVFTEAVTAYVGLDEISYMAMQRAMRLWNIKTRAELLDHMQDVMKTTSLFIDAFVLGCNWKERK